MAEDPNNHLSIYTYLLTDSRGPIIERLVDALLIVKAQVVPQLFSCFTGTGVIFYIYLLIFNRSPQAFGKNIVKRSTFTIHTDAHIMREQQLCVLQAGKLTAFLQVERSEWQYT